MSIIAEIWDNPKLPSKRMRVRVIALHLIGWLLLIRVETTVRLFDRRRRRASGETLATACPERILVLRADGIGDFVMTLPLLDSLRRRFPHAAIDVVCYQWSKDLAVMSGLFDKVIAIGPGLHGFLAWRDLIRRLRRHSYGMVIDARGDWRYVLFAWLVRAPFRIGFRNSGFGYLLTHALPADRAHQVEQCLLIARAMNAPAVSPEPSLSLTDTDRRFAVEWLRKQGCGPENPIIAMHAVHAARPAKVWSPERFAEIGDRLHDRIGARILLLGSREDALSIASLASRFHTCPIQAAGTLSLRQTISVLARCRCFIGIDSGVAHAAAAIGCPAVVLFAATDPALYRPWSDRCRVIRPATRCHPRCNQSVCAVPDRHCMNEIDIEEVDRAVIGIMTSFFPPGAGEPGGGNGCA